METLIYSFDGEDRDFYNREFDFFREVTSISGKLKPFIKKTKAEKKVCALIYDSICSIFLTKAGKN
jgi:hypothetical protein